MRVDLRDRRGRKGVKMRREEDRERERGQERVRGRRLLTGNRRIAGVGWRVVELETERPGGSQARVFGAEERRQGGLMDGDDGKSENNSFPTKG